TAAAGSFEHLVPAVGDPQQLAMFGDQGGQRSGACLSEEWPGEFRVELGPHDEWVDEALHRAGQWGTVSAGQHRFRQASRTPGLVEDEPTRQHRVLARHRQSPEGRYDRAMPELT